MPFTGDIFFGFEEKRAILAMIANETKIIYSTGYFIKVYDYVAKTFTKKFDLSLEYFEADTLSLGKSCLYAASSKRNLIYFMSLNLTSSNRICTNWLFSQILQGGVFNFYTKFPGDDDHKTLLLHDNMTISFKYDNTEFMYFQDEIPKINSDRKEKILIALETEGIQIFDFSYDPYFHNMTCYQTCGDGFYKAIDYVCTKLECIQEVKCYSCHPLCKTCRRYSNYECNTCKKDAFSIQKYETDEMICLDHCPENAHSFENGTCKCNDGFGLDFNYYNLVCIDCKLFNEPHCKEFNYFCECIVCKDGYFFDISRCVQCEYGCLTCLNLEICNKCLGDWDHISDKCYDKCENGTYRNSIQECAKCPEPCLTCNVGTTGNYDCLSCFENEYQLINGQCLSPDQTFIIFITVVCPLAAWMLLLLMIAVYVRINRKKMKNEQGEAYPCGQDLQRPFTSS